MSRNWNLESDTHLVYLLFDISKAIHGEPRHSLTILRKLLHTFETCVGLSALLFGAAEDHRFCGELISDMRCKVTRLDHVDQGDNFRQDFVHKMVLFGWTNNSSKYPEEKMEMDSVPFHARVIYK